MFRRKKAGVNVLKRLNTSAIPWCDDAFLISVANGMGALAVRVGYAPDLEYASAYYSALELRGVPLIQARLPGCPTCAGMLAAGYGIGNCDSAELRRVGERLNADFVDLATSVDALTPLLCLLSSGLYVVADAILYPTDGDGHFFWDVPNRFTENPATAEVSTEDFCYIEGFPAFLYPSQSGERFDEQRVRHYVERFSRSGNWPRAVSYQFREFVGVLLDGHHKVAAAALLGKEARCIAILPASGRSYAPRGRFAQAVDAVHFSGIRVAADDIPPSLLRPPLPKPDARSRGGSPEYRPANPRTRAWEREYQDSAKRYPGPRELAEGAALGIAGVTDELIAECLSNQSAEHLRKLRHIVALLSRTGDPRRKELALRCGRMRADPLLMEASFNALARIKGDGDIEDFFVEYLVDHRDPHDGLKAIADGYWT